jgi:hypothetical protein
MSEYTTIQVTKKLNQRVLDLAKVVAKHEGLSRLDKQQLLEKALKVYEDSLEG